MNGHRLTTLVAMLAMVAMTATGCDWGNDGAGDPNEALCITDQDCVDGGVCDPDSGECVECLLDAHCPLSKKCDGETHLCVGCLADADCPDGSVCDSAHHLCVECMDDADCGDGGQCDEEKNVCIECVDDSDCAYPDTPCAFAACMSGECVTGSVPDGLPCNDGDPCTMKDMCLDGDCVGGNTDPECIPTGCEGAPDGTPCDDGDACTLDDLCLDGECMGGAITPECAEQDLDGDGFTPEEGDCDDADPLVNPAVPEDCDTAVDDDCDGEVNEGCQEECFPTGCSGEICASQDVGSDCDWKPEYECLKFSVCGNFGENGGCAWLLTDEYIACLEGMCLPEEICGNGLDDDCDGIVDNGCMTGCEDDSDCPLGEMCEIYCGNGWCEGVCVPVEPPNLCEEEGGTCFPFWDENGDGLVCPAGWGEVDLPGCPDDEICCFDQGPGECEVDSDCPPVPDLDGCTKAYCINGMCVYETDPNCGGDDCWGDWMCANGQYCYFEGCAAETGTCTDQSDFCPEYYSPVCGCDGETYDNICFLQSAGQSLDYMGVCEEPMDMDGDGWTILEGDCDDLNPDINPGAVEVCDDLDNDCDGVVDEGVCGGECKDLTGIDFGACAMFMGFALMDGACVGISGCGCMDYCDAIFNSMDECKEACEEPNLCEAFGGFCSEPSADGVFYGCPPGSAEVDLPGCGEWSACCLPDEPPECGGPCECYDLYGNDFSEPCPMMCPTCDNYWACESGSCVESCGPVPDEAMECLCADEEICGNNLDDDCDGEVDEGCENPCGGFIGLPCNAGEFCLYPDDTCEWADMMGTCQVIPDGCYYLWDPVCGCDGETYANECLLWMNQLSKAHDGECDQPNECEDACDCYDLYGDEFSQPCELDCYSCDNYWSCEAGACVESCGPVPEEISECLEEPCGGFAGFTCSDPDTEFCLYPAGTCLWADMMGVCTPYPNPCPLLWDPVCGCDGTTYSNECAMWVSGVSMDHEGECEEPPECSSDADCEANDPCVKGYCIYGLCQYIEDPDCGNGCWSNDMCGEDEFCLFGACAAETGACWPKPQACPFLWNPVCGCDGETHANQCIAWSAGVSVDYEGECEQACTPEGEGFSTLDPSIEACCPGLSAIVQAEFDPVTGMCMMVGNAFVCTYCGDGDCGLGENLCNCEEDCAENPGECEALDPYGYGPCDAVLGYAWNGDSCTVFSGCDCGEDCDQFFATWTACMDSCAPKPEECVEINPNAWGDCEMVMGVGFDGEKCVYVSGCGCGNDPATPPCDGLFETMDECVSACFSSDPDGF